MASKKGDCDYMIKLLIIGDSGVGKTCLLMRFCESSFTNNHLTTIGKLLVVQGIDFKLKTLDVDGKKVKMQIWDTAGQERFRTITQTYYKGAQGIILVYGIDDRVSFQNIENWMKQINLHAQEKVCKLIIGNKSDATQRVVETHEGQKLADSYGVKFFETSAKQGTNVYEIFNSMAKLVVETQNQKPEGNTSTISLNQQASPQPSEKVGGCC